MINSSRVGALILGFAVTVIVSFSTCVSAQSNLDFVPPKVLHEPESEPISADKPYVLTATITDDSGVGKVTLFYRTIGESSYQSTELLFSGSSDTFVVELDTSELKPPGLEYYLQAEDVAGNTLLKGFSFEPLVLQIDAGSANAVAAKSKTPEKKKGLLGDMSSKNLLLIGLGAVAVVGLAASGGGGGGGGGSDDTVTITAPIPQ
jgi:hypothetical protein